VLVGQKNNNMQAQRCRNITTQVQIVYNQPQLICATSIPFGTTLQLQQLFSVPLPCTYHHIFKPLILHPPDKLVLATLQHKGHPASKHPDAPKPNISLLDLGASEDKCPEQKRIPSN